MNRRLMISVCGLVLSSFVVLWSQSPIQRRQATLSADAPIYLSAKPAPKAQPLRTLSAGTTVRLLEEGDGWVQVEFADPQFGTRIGWMQKQFIKAEPVPPAPAAAPSPAPSPIPIPPPSVQPTTVAKQPTVAPAIPAPKEAAAVAKPQQPTDQAEPSKGQKLRNIKIRGYVTEVTSPLVFDIEDYRITRADGFSLDFENASPEIQFNLEDIRVGVELEIRGQLNDATGELRAQSIRVDLEQFKSQKVTGIVSASPRGLVHGDDGWSGQVFSDGQTIDVRPSTVVVFKPTAQEKKQTAKAGLDTAPIQPLATLDEIQTGMLITYEGKRDRLSGHILAERVEFSRNDLEEGEAKLWKTLKTSVKTAQGFTPGELKIDRVGKYKLLNSESVQAYVSSVATRLIPSYQASLAPDDPRKIPFQVHVVEDKSANAFATANGIIVVHTGLIELLENEAQLAAVLGHEVVHSTHEHTWRASQADKKKRIGLQIAAGVAAGFGQYDLANLASMVESAIRTGYGRGLENQADRVGLQAMVTAGYDPRQAPAVWKLMAKEYGNQPTNFFYSTHENHATRRSYLMNELKNNYRDLDYATLKVNSEQYAAVKSAMREALSSKPKIKVR